VEFDSEKTLLPMTSSKDSVKVMPWAPVPWKALLSMIQALEFAIVTMTRYISRAPSSVVADVDREKRESRITRELLLAIVTYPRKEIADASEDSKTDWVNKMLLLTVAEISATKPIARRLPVSLLDAMVQVLPLFSASLADDVSNLTHKQPMPSAENEELLIVHQLLLESCMLPLTSTLIESTNPLPSCKLMLCINSDACSARDTSFSMICLSSGSVV
jgi:hypothetical protein